MCGRYSLTADVDAMRRLFAFMALPNLAPRYNICPTQTAPIVRPASDGTRELAQLRWGIPGGPENRPLINARGETVMRLPSFRDSFRLRRCLVPADGFYEWRKEENNQPFRIGLKGGAAFAFAGIWQDDSFTIVTTSANDKLRPIHDRMPVILTPESYAAWLDVDAPDFGAALNLLRSYPPEEMAFYRVGPRVNSARNDDPECVAPLNPK